MIQTARTGPLRAGVLAGIGFAAAVCGALSVGVVPTILQQQTAFLPLAAAIGLGMGLVSGLSGGLAAKVSASLVPAASWALHSVIAGAVAGGVSWALGTGVPLVAPLPIAAIIGSVTAVATAFVLVRANYETAKAGSSRQ